jgi:hypothetical protein
MSLRGVDDANRGGPFQVFEMGNNFKMERIDARADFAEVVTLKLVGDALADELVNYPVRLPSLKPDEVKPPIPVVEECLPYPAIADQIRDRAWLKANLGLNPCRKPLKCTM